jgi:hypothetical protein
MVSPGRVLKTTVVALGASPTCWEVPIMRENPPNFILSRNGDVMIYDCHPVIHRQKPNRYLLAKPNYTFSRRVLIRINTFVREESDEVGFVEVENKSAQIIAYGSRKKAADVLLVANANDDSSILIHVDGDSPRSAKFRLIYLSSGLVLVRLVATPAIPSQTPKREVEGEQQGVAVVTPTTASTPTPAEESKPEDNSNSVEVTDKDADIDIRGLMDELGRRQVAKFNSRYNRPARKHQS